MTLHHVNNHQVYRLNSCSSHPSVRCHPRSMILVPIESTYATSY